MRLSLGYGWAVAWSALCGATACSDPAPKPATAVATTADAATDAVAGDVVALLDLGSTDVGPAQLSCPGGAGCPCTSNGECQQTGVCADDGQSATAKACAFPFGAGCAPGYVAFTADTGEGATVCVPSAPKLCNPCEKDDDCKAAGGSGALCVDHGAVGRFCGIACPAGGCPKGYTCADATGSSGAKAKQCQASEQSPPTCLCSPAAVAAQLSTPCLVNTAAGSCGGVRVCGPSGLSACSGKVPTPESCNGQDDDCNGQTDEGPLCDDGDACTVGEACAAGACKPGAAKVCEDGDLCTVGEVCVGGSCSAGKAVACDGGACEVGSCSKATGKCAFAVKPEGSPCDDGNACTLGDLCSEVLCIGVPKACSDNEPCTVDSCGPDGSCAATVAPDGQPCDSGQLCLTGEHCKAGSCEAGSAKAPCQCASNGDCKAYDDGLACNGTMYCDKSTPTWTCKANPASVVQCPVSTYACKTIKCLEVGDPGQTTVCAPSGLPDGTTCSDGLAWTVGDVCEKAVCVGTNTKLCTATADCAKYEDGDLCNGTLFCNKAIGTCLLNPATVVYCPTADNTPCRQNLCAAKTGLCVLTAINELKACEDGNLCTTGEACVQGECKPSVGGGNTCGCTKDADCAAFEDGDACNGKLFCNLAKQKCEVNPKTVIFCPNGNDGPCAKNTCAKATGLCAMLANPSKVECDADGNPCTPVDLCVSGKCVADTANVCGCQVDTDCADDTDLCNGVPYCDKASNVCIANPKTVITCDKANDTACVVTHCQPGTGKCVKGNSTAPCSDGDPCTVGDVCLAGVCKPGGDTCGACKVNGDCDDKDACTDDLCSGQPKACSHSNNTAPCNDGQACTSGDGCADGKCAGKPQVCDDQEPCTSDGCQGGTCVFLAANSATCTDGDACTVGDFCLNKNCKAGQGNLDCDDKVGCTADSCDVFKGCVHAAGVCDDKTVCTDDLCDPKKGCVFTAKPACDDSNACTADSCDAVKGCVYLPTTATCTDGNACSVGDVCGGSGSCLTGAVTACDDGNVCTKDACDPAKGCAAVPTNAGKACASDGNACTTDVCDTAGACTHAAKGKVCGDGACCGGETPSDCAADCSGCGDGLCDGDETVPNCPTDCGFLAKRLAGPCTKPGAVDTCGDSFVCVDRGAAGGGPVCVADFATWVPFADSHPAGDFVEAGDYVTDSKTGLMWAKEALPAQNWASALTACKDKTYGGFKDWRLPVRDELRSLVDFGKQQPACEAPGLSIPSDLWPYWSATPWVGGGSAWSVYFNNGYSYSLGTTSSYRVRCVR